MRVRSSGCSAPRAAPMPGRPATGIITAMASTDTSERGAIGGAPVDGPPTGRHPAAPGAAEEAAALSPQVLARLMIWLSPSFPIGAFSYSHGLEWVIGVGDVADAGSLLGWVADV